MNSLHPLLRRQLQRHPEYVDVLSDSLEAFLKVVNDAYLQFDEDRRMLERSLELTSQELLTKNALLQHDLEERRRAEQRLQESEKQLKDFLEEASIGMHWVDANGVILWANRTELAMLGYAAEEYIGRPLAEFHADADVLADMMQQLSRGKVLKDYAARLRCKDGSIRHVLIDSNVLWENGTFVHTRCFTRDITDQQQAYDILKDNRQELETKAVELEARNTELRRREKITRSLLEDLQNSKEALQTANKRLNELSVLKDEFVAKVSHELRTPLTAIKEGISLVLDQALGEINGEQREFLTTVDENIERLAELINNMLDLSKIEAGRLHLMRKRQALRPLIETVITSYKSLAGRRVIRVESDGAAEVFCDVNRIIQIFNNLLSNAIKFTPDDGTIVFSIVQQNGSVGVAVQDSGIGIAPEDLPKLFKKFTQVGAGQNKPKSTGLGLALCKELAELHHGSLSVTAELGKGSCFHLTLPAYSESLALEESLQELVVSTKQSGEEGIALLLVDCRPLMEALARSGTSKPVDRFAQSLELVRKYLHRGDAVLGLEGDRVAVLAVTDPEGVRAMVDRLRRAIPESAAALAGVTVPIGMAMFPGDGEHAAELLRKAAASPELSSDIRGGGGTG